MAILLGLILLVLVAAFFPGALLIVFTMLIFGIGYAVFGTAALVTMLMLLALVYLAQRGDAYINTKRGLK